MSKFRIGVCKLMYETNSFSAREVDLSYFKAPGRVHIGSALFEQSQSRCELTGFLNACKVSGQDIEVVPLLSKDDDAQGNVTAESVGYLEELLRSTLREAGPLDGILLALHGAMASAEVPDLDGHFLKIVRQETAGTIPVVCTLDMHAAMTRRMVDLATAITGYRTTPHVDIMETGERAARILLKTLSGRIKPVVAMQKVPMIVPPNEAGTTSGPLKDLFDQVVALSELDGVVDCSFFTSNFWLDVPEQGWTALVVTDNDYPLARRLARQLAAQAWEVRREVLPGTMVPAQEAVQSAAAVEGRPVIILDSADMPAGGAPGDSTELLRVLLAGRETVDGFILLDLPDPQAVQQIVAAGQGATVTVYVGGKRDTRFSRPVAVTGEVLCVTDGPIESVWKDRATPWVDAGKIVCLGIDNVRLVLTEQMLFYPQPTLYRKVGIEPFEAKIVAVKTAVIGYKMTYEHGARAVFTADCRGATSFNLNNFEYARIDRPIYPLDPDMDWHMEDD